MTSLRTRAVLYGLVIVLGLLSALPNALPARLADRLPDWYSANTLSLGLDLQGAPNCCWKPTPPNCWPMRPLP